ncbi:hypothetical protein ABK040_009761 [Willaertia magna]
MTLPSFSQDEILILMKNFPPRKINDIKNIYNILKQYSGNIFILIIIIYLFLLSFSIPGTFGLNVLFGALYGNSTVLGVFFPFLISLICGTLGGFFAYLLSFCFLGNLLLPYIEKYLIKFRNLLKNNNKIFILLFLRISPILPNWSINLISPLLNIDILTFIFTTFIGIAPQTFISVQTGKMLSETTMMGGDNDVTYNQLNVFLSLLGFGSLFLLPVIVNYFVKVKLD